MNLTEVITSYIGISSDPSDAIDSILNVTDSNN